MPREVPVFANFVAGLPPQPQNPAPNKRVGVSADIEFFLKDRNNTFWPASKLGIGGIKGEPVWIDQFTGLLEDNAALELNMPPSYSAPAFRTTAIKARQQLFNTCNFRNFLVKLSNHVAVTDKLIKEYPKLLEFGCLEDYIAYGSEPTKPRPPLNAEMLGNHRYAAGHLHISYPTEIAPPHIIARWLDLTIGLSSLKWDIQPGRREFYGLAGLYRPTKYPNGASGVEYRTLSNLWMFTDVEIKYLGESIFYTLNYILDNVTQAKTDYKKIPWAEVQEAINKNSIVEADEILEYLADKIELLERGVAQGILRHLEHYPFAIEA